MPVSTLADKASQDERGLVVAKAACRSADQLGLNQRELAEIIGVSPAQVSRLKTGGTPVTGKSYELAAYLIRIFRSLDAITGGHEATTKAWLRNRNTDLDGIPADIITSAAGLVDVMNYLDASRAPI